MSTFSRNQRMCCSWRCALAQSTLLALVPNEVGLRSLRNELLNVLDHSSAKLMRVPCSQRGAVHVPVSGLENAMTLSMSAAALLMEKLACRPVAFCMGLLFSSTAPYAHWSARCFGRKPGISFSILARTDFFHTKRIPKDSRSERFGPHQLHS